MLTPHKLNMPLPNDKYEAERSAGRQALRGEGIYTSLLALSHVRNLFPLTRQFAIANGGLSPRRG